MPTDMTPEDVAAIRTSLDRFGYDPAHPEYATMRALCDALEAAWAECCPDRQRETEVLRERAELAELQRDSIERAFVATEMARVRAEAELERTVAQLEKTLTRESEAVKRAERAERLLAIETERKNQMEIQRNTTCKWNQELSIKLARIRELCDPERDEDGDVRWVSVKQVRAILDVE